MFSRADMARQAAELLIRLTDIIGYQVYVLDPDYPDIERKLQPATRDSGTARAWTLVAAGTAGLITGLIIALVLIVSGHVLFAANPYTTLGTLATVGAITGLLLGAVVSPGTRHDRLGPWVQHATRKGYWFVLVHTRNHDQERSARSLLQGMSDKVMIT